MRASAWWRSFLLTDRDPLAELNARTIDERRIASFYPYALISAVYIFATWLTRPYFQGDTLDYVVSIIEPTKGKVTDFWEFGHLFWQPFGWLAFRVSGPFLAKLVGPDQRLQVTLLLIGVSWFAGLASAVILLALLRLYCARGWIPQLVVASFVFSTAVLDYSRTGCSYISGLFFLILAMYLIAREAKHHTGSIGMQICAGLALAGSVALWFPYVLAVPGAILLPFASETPDRNQLRLSIGTLFFFCVSIVCAYVAVLIHIRLSSIDGILAWMRASSHGIAMGGIPRMIFGWPRSLMYMGDAGRIIKRHLLHDPFNPISTLGLLRLWPELLELGLFYVTLLAVIVNMCRSSNGRRALAAVIVAALPVLGFAIHWTGAALERYLPLSPVFFLVLCLSLSDLRAPKWTKTIVWIFVLFLVAHNALDLQSRVIRDSQVQSEIRVNELVPRLRPGSLVIVSHNLDDLVGFNWNFPFNQVNRSGALSVYPLLTGGNPDVPEWRESFASRVFRSWRVGGDIWISNRLLQRTPHQEWNWVEGDDKRVSWSDLNLFFSHLQYGQSVGGDVGSPGTELEFAL